MADIMTQSQFEKRLKENGNGIFNETIENAVISGLASKGAELRGCTINNTTFSQCDFAGGSFDKSVFSNCKFLNCNFISSSFNWGKYSRTIFINCNFNGAELFESDFSFADFTNSIFDWAKIIDSDLRNTILENISLKGTGVIRNKLYNHQQFSFRNVDFKKIENNDFSELGDGSEIIPGIEILEKLQK